jgi:hypothetical protein
MSEPDTAARLVTAAGVRTYVRGRLDHFETARPPTRLPEGNLNVVWRVPGAERSLILKYAPPYIAASPETPLDPSRLRIEARCLCALGTGGHLHERTGAAVRSPKLRDQNLEVPVLLMEDIGPVPSWGRWLRTTGTPDLSRTAAAQGRRLGHFLGRLHATTHDDERCAAAFDNRPMQRTRLAVQYRGVTDMLAAAGVPDADALGRRAEALGQRLLERGRCLTMGDLWPPSVLVTDEGLRIIDWELAHYGRPLQDVAHWLSHLWMQIHRAPSAAVAEAAAEHRDSFLGGYIEALGDREGELWDDAERRDATVHFGAEILVRAVGPFQDGYVYGGLGAEDPVVQDAVTTAARHLRAPEANGIVSRW